MSATRNLFPDTETLTQSLKNISDNRKSPGNQIKIIDREKNPLKSTYPSEIVTCALPDGSQVRLFCKYAAGRSHEAFGHRNGVTYEAMVYGMVLQRLPVSTPAFYGLHKDETKGEIWLIIEYLDQCKRGSFDPLSYDAAARWLGQFHRANETRFSPSSLSYLHRYDAEYYLGWSVRTSKFAGSMHRRFPWLETLCKRFEEEVEKLLEPPAIIIHGEYYPGNILSCQEIIYPVDWESTAVAIGEIDLASLTEHWPSEIVDRCKAAYQSARWPNGAPPDFEQRLDLANLYWRFRWLGEQPEWTNEQKSEWRFEQLQTIGERLGLI